MTTGTGFEEEIKRSLPKKTSSGRPIYRWKVPSTSAWRQDHGKGDERRRFSAKMPFDFLVVAAANTMDPDLAPVASVITFALECKSAIGKIARSPKSRAGKLHATLPFSRVSKEQAKGLSDAGAAGAVAGILWLVEMEEPPTSTWIAEAEPRHQCWFIPIEAWTEYVEFVSGTTVKSLGLDDVHRWDVFTHPAVQIYEDIDRGTSNRYWKMGEFMRDFGADASDK